MNKFMSLMCRRLLFRGDNAAFARHLGAKIGPYSKILTCPVELLGSEPYLVEMGSHVQVTSGVRFVTHDGGVWVLRERHPEVDVFGKIVVGNNVFIGFNAIVLPGVTIGDNCVIGAGSVVTRSIPANSVVAGVPAKVVKTFDEYHESSLAKSLGTKKLSAAEKKRALLQKFG